jgi:hypothetical protein
MTDAEALEYVQAHQLYAFGSRSSNGTYSWVVATANTGPWRGTGPTLSAALADALELKRVDEAVEDLL